MTLVMQNPSKYLPLAEFLEKWNALSPEEQKKVEPAIYVAHDPIGLADQEDTQPIPATGLPLSFLIHLRNRLHDNLELVFLAYELPPVFYDSNSYSDLMFFIQALIAQAECAGVVDPKTWSEQAITAANEAIRAIEYLDRVFTEKCEQRAAAGGKEFKYGAALPLLKNLGWR